MSLSSAAAVSLSSPPIPGPRSLPVIGFYRNLFRFFRDPIATLERLHAEYGDIAALQQNNPKYVFVFTSELNKAVLSNTEVFHAHDVDSLPVRPPENSSLSRLYRGVHQMNGSRHAQHRRLMQPAFQTDRVLRYHTDMQDLTERTLAKWSLGCPLNLYKELRSLTLDIAIKTLLGINPEECDLSELLESWIRRVFSLSSVALPINLPGLPYRRLLRLSDQLEARIGQLIQRVLPVSVPELVWRMVYAGDLRFLGGRAWVARSVGNCRRS